MAHMHHMRENPKQERLRALLDYNPETGEFFWRERNDCSASRFNGKKAGQINSSGYNVITVEGQTWMAARLAWIYVYGKLDGSVDHINRVKTDDRLINLRECSWSDNCFNRPDMPNRKLPRGVNFQSGKYVARITKNRRTMFLGAFESVAAAKWAYDCAAENLYAWSNP